MKQADAERLLRRAVELLCRYDDDLVEIDTQSFLKEIRLLKDKKGRWLVSQQILDRLKALKP